MTENIELVQGIWADFPRGGLEAVIDRFAPDVEWVIDDEQRTVRGHDGLREYFRKFEDMGAELIVLPYDFEERGDFVLVPATLRVQTPQSMAESQTHILYQLRDGLVVRVRSFVDAATARAAIAAAERQGSESPG